MDRCTPAAPHCALAAFLLATLPAAGRAETPPEPAAARDVRTLERIVVTGGRPSTLPIEIPTTTEGVDAATIERTVNATDSEDALKYLPSLLVRKRYIGDHDHAVLATRASGTGNSARSLVYADGVLLSNLLGNGASFTPRWGLVTPEEIERVDVLYGPFSAAYPGNSAGAIVDFVTRMPRQFEAHLKLQAFTQDYRLYGTDGRYSGHQASASLGDRSGDWSWWINVNRLHNAGHPLSFANRLVSAGTPGAGGTPVSGAAAGLDPRNRPWLLFGTTGESDTVQDHAKLKLAYDFSPTLRASYTLGWWRNDVVRNVDSFLRDAAGNAVHSGTVNVDGRQYTLAAADFAPTRGRLEHVTHGLSLKSNTRGTWDWEIAASLYDYLSDRVRMPTGAVPAALAGGAGRITDLDGTGWNTLAFKGIWRPDGPQGAHIVEAGVQRDAFRLRTRVDDTADWLGGDAAGALSAFTGRTTLTSLWAQDAWRWSPRWRSVLGLRVEHWRADDGSVSNAGSTLPFAPRDETHLSPKAALAYQLDDAWRLKASLGRAVRMPTVSELYQGSISTNVIVNNDPNLRPEKSWTGELSAERDLGYGVWRTTLFAERTVDALYSQTNVTVTPNVTNIQNVDAIRTSGLELALQTSSAWIRGLDLSGSLTYADSRIVKNDKFPASVGKWQPRVPRWRATLLATQAFDEHWTASLGARYSGRQYGQLDNSDPNGFAFTGFSRYFVADLRLRYRFDAHWALTAGIDNLNDARYWAFHPYPQRSFSVELKYDH